MRVFLGLLFLGLVYPGFGPLLNAQISQPLAPLPLQGEPRETQIAPFSTLAGPQCDASGSVYVRYSSQADAGAPAALAVIQSDGTTQTITLRPSGQTPDESHVFLFSAASDGSLHEIVRAPDPSDQDQPATYIRYTSFDSDGSLRSESTFEKEFIPSLLVPLPDGNFFASGVTLQETHEDGIAETPLVGIFNADARLVAHLTDGIKRSKTKQAGDTSNQETDTAFDGGIAKLASDGTLYLLLPGDHARVAVVSESGLISREMTLREPFESDVAHDMWISGNRLLVIYEGESNDPKNAYVYVLYDLQTGNVIRSYHPEFSGTVACFQDGDSLTVLLEDQSSGKVSLGSAELQ